MRVEEDEDRGGTKEVIEGGFFGSFGRVCEDAFECDKKM